MADSPERFGTPAAAAPATSAGSASNLANENPIGGDATVAGTFGGRFGTAVPVAPIAPPAPAAAEFAPPAGALSGASCATGPPATAGPAGMSFGTSAQAPSVIATPRINTTPSSHSTRLERVG